MIQTVKTEAVELSQNECKRVAIRYICEKFEWKPTYYIEEGEKVLDEVECLGSHSFTMKKFIRKATEQDYLTEKLLQSIK